MDSKIKNLLLISPKRPLWAKSEKITSMFERNNQFIRPWYAPPLGLLTIAAVTPKTINVQFVDEDFEEIDYSRSYDVVGISLMTQQAYRAYQIADEFRNRNVNVVMGGIHPSVMPEEALEHADSVFIGEAEETWLEYLNDFNKDKIKKIYKKDDSCIYDIKNSPLPRYHLLKNENVKKNQRFFNFFPVQATRGCPHNCSFCLVTQTYGKKIRKKEIKQVCTEIEEILKFNNNPLILFADDNLMVDRNYAIELFKALIPYRIMWFGQADNRVGNDPELLKYAYNSGCSTLLIGFESLNSENLKGVNQSHWKMKQIEKYKNTVQNIQNNGIVAFSAFIIGFEYDNKETFKDIRDFMLDNHCPGQITFLTPVPGSQLYKEYFKQNKLLDEKFWDKTNFFDIVFKHPVMSKTEMEDGMIWLYDEVFNAENYFKRAAYMKEIYKLLPSRWLDMK